MHITFIRHGETPANVNGTMQDLEADMKLTLTEKGIQQAKEVGELLKNNHFDAIFVSDMHRTQETARYIFPDRVQDFILDARIREHILSLKTGVSYSYFDIGKESWAKRRLEGFPDGGESFPQQVARVQDFLQELATKPYQNVAVVTHGGCIRSLYVISGIYDYLDALLVYSAKNCGIIEGELDENGKLTLEME